MLSAVLMMLFLCWGGCEVKAVAYLPTLFSCRAFDYEQAQFRATIGTTTPEAIPIKETVVGDLERAPDELKKLARKGVESVFEASTDFQQISPFVKRCCDKPTYGCTGLDIPLRYIRYWGHFCYVVHPYGNNSIKYKKCTCLTCVYQGDCPAIGRCVETDYVYSRVIAYCPRLNWPYRWVKLMVRFPTDCKCMTRCPSHPYYPYYPYARSLSAPSAQPGVLLDGAVQAQSADAAGQAAAAERDAPGGE